MKNSRIHLFGLLLAGLFVFVACKTPKTDDKPAQEEKTYTITKESLRKHIRFLASDKMKGRAAGTPEMKQAADYIIGGFKAAGLMPVGTSFTQPFEITPCHSRSGDPEKVQADNIIGLLEGADSLLKKEYIILGAHYDHIGMARNTNAVCNGADDNASGVALLLEVARKLNSVKDGLKRSILFVAFDAEEQGLLGSHHFVTHPVVPFDKISLMMNFDMVGRIASGDSLAVSGGETFEGGTALLNLFADTTSIHLYTTDRHVFASDHTPFFRNRIPIISLLPKLHPEYHTCKDDEHLINYDTMGSVCEYAFHVASMLANRDSIVPTIENLNQGSDGTFIIFGRN